MASDTTVSHITDGLAKATFKDGAFPTGVKLANEVLRKRAAVTTIDTNLEVVWYKPHRNIWLHFRNRASAEEAVQALHGSVVKGLQLRCDLKMTNKPNIELFTAHISDAIETIALVDLSPLIRHQPVDAIFGAFNYPTATDEIKLLRERIQEKVGEPVENFRMVETSNILKCKANFGFASEAPNLSTTARSLNGTVVQEFGKSKIFVTEYLSLYLAIDNDIFTRHSKAFKGIANTAWKDQKIKVKIFDGDLRSRRGTFLVSIRGNGRTEVRKVKAMIDDLVAADAIAELQRETRDVPRTYKVELKLAKDYKRALSGGVARLEALLGKTNVDFNDDNDTPNVTYKASAGKAKKVRHILLADAPLSVTTAGSCEICAEDSVELLPFPGCGHSACLQCLEDYCSVDMSGDKLPLRCFVDPTCKAVFTTAWLLEQLPAADSQELFRNAIAIHCQEDPSSFMRCTGPDCDQHLSISPKFSKEICPSCLTVNCTTCKRQYHFGQTCKQSQDKISRDDELVERHLAENGGKRCPRCNEPTVQNGGCNHMQCPSCHVHYCWQCLAVFVGMGETYAHMEQVHGTNGLGAQDLPAILLPARLLGFGPRGVQGGGLNAQDVALAMWGEQARMDQRMVELEPWDDDELGPPGAGLDALRRVRERHDAAADAGIDPFREVQERNEAAALGVARPFREVVVNHL